MTKSPDAFRTISEVAAWLETPAHVLRFWESRFPELSPVKRAGGRRYYRPEDMQLLGGIKHLLHTEGHTIKSVQDRIKAEGTGVVIAFSPPLGDPAEAPDGACADPVSDAPSHGSNAAKAPPAARMSGASPADAAPAPAATGADHPDTPAPGPSTDPAESHRTPAQLAADELPPIGFFFDDSDDAIPAEAQSGTFASLDEETPEGPEPEPEPESTPAPEPAQHPEDDPAPVAEQVATPPDDPSDEAPLGTPPVVLAARLRTFVPGSLSADQTARLIPLVARLRALGPGSH